ncbi:hypothetical protein EN925_26695 [Mesorhizobium sp. M7A.F.Ca.US.006.04.2.1]|uniref:hypothetical protein n=1 Tax=unclassified Mesorhizobium TaxID=325217 RepID=UPI000FCA9231|nr:MULTISPECIES: hypothetical protein [unclassified Mesorhizobium]RUX76224.1 hypothetical protein EN990_10675 [Mesorhizobium sp. M7A.F.Ca.US.005.03.1.1]RUY15492.1 hypothetical protein EN991_14650 [Mesorhizobium sp. M7A.F.Ca.US.005.03.2.1]RUY30304.1 hypothetical protein EN979_07325 [Mesorhizobium sp. M7A.F.Ca.US.001.04.2.1]RUY41769.1 hypothetical protein EN978_14275 [Mesorhizobium sp. M7A.F.Ca.US.001.04.1.1]RUZ98868.1 hypothetical protein EN938_30235 [Mesorhizobium sp. M7A.F.Ca.US.001.02.1.1]
MSRRLSRLELELQLRGLILWQPRHHLRHDLAIKPGAILIGNVSVLRASAMMKQRRNLKRLRRPSPACRHVLPV